MAETETRAHEWLERFEQSWAGSSLAHDAGPLIRDLLAELAAAQSDLTRAREAQGAALKDAATEKRLHLEWYEASVKACDELAALRSRIVEVGKSHRVMLDVAQAAIDWRWGSFEGLSSDAIKHIKEQTYPFAADVIGRALSALVKDAGGAG